jgi:hypothetical protein
LRLCHGLIIQLCTQPGLLQSYAFDVQSFHLKSLRAY